MDVKLQSKKLLDWFQDDRLTYENQANYLSKLVTLRESLYEKTRNNLDSGSFSHFKLNPRSLIAANDTMRTSITSRNSSYNLFLASSSNFNSTESKSSVTESQTVFNSQSLLLSSNSTNNLKTSHPILFKFPSRKSEQTPTKKTSLPAKKELTQKQFLDIVDGKNVFENENTTSFTEHVTTPRQQHKQPKQLLNLNPANLESINRLKKLLNLEESASKTQPKVKTNLSNTQSIRRTRNPLSTFRLANSRKEQETISDKTELQVANANAKEKPKTVKKIVPKANTKNKHDTASQRKVVEYCYSSFNVAISIHAQPSYQNQSYSSITKSSNTFEGKNTHRSQNGAVSSSNQTTFSTVNSRKDFEEYSSFEESSAPPCTPKNGCNSPTCFLCTIDKIDSIENHLKVPVVRLKSKTNSDLVKLYEQKSFDLVNPQNSPEPTAEILM